MIALGSVCQVNPKKGQDKRVTSGLEISFVPMPAVSESGEIDPSEVRVYDAVKTGFTYFAENDVLFAKITPCMEMAREQLQKDCTMVLDSDLLNSMSSARYRGKLILIGFLR